MPTRLRLLAFLCAAALGVAGCTARPVASPAATPSSSLTTPSPAPLPTHVAFEVDRVVAHDRMLASTIGVREAGSPAFVKAADYVASEFVAYGYSVSRQRVPMPAGRSAGVPVPAGTTQNVIAVPPGYEPASPHLLVGAHLDSVAKSPGANDNASGVALMLELARLARGEPTPMPIVWVAFGGEERRFKGTSGATFGSRSYLDHLADAERKALRGVLAIDMVGHGTKVLVCSGGQTPKTLVNAALAAATRIGVPALEQVILVFFSDHTPFERAGFTVAWLWSGDHSSVHTPNDTMAVIQPEELDRVGRVAWETLRTLAL